MNSTPDEIETSLCKVLNSHGHGFHYAVLRHIESLRKSRIPDWDFMGAEFPVIVNGESTHVDFVLQSQCRRLLLLAECKRAHPARSVWAFIKAPYTAKNQRSPMIAFEQFLFRKGDREYSVQQHCSPFGPYHLGIELKSDGQGDPDLRARGGIDDAVAQVLRSTSGLTNHFVGRKTAVAEEAITFIPAIFTTATLWVTDCDLGAANLETGNIERESLKLRTVPWLWFNHNRSPSLCHDFPFHVGMNELNVDLQVAFTRSIAIVSVSGIDAFISRETQDCLRGI